MEILDGKLTSASIKEEIAQDVAKFVASGGRKPHLAAVLVGENGASLTYVNAKVKACEQVGFDSTLVQLPVSISEEALLSEIDKLNKDASLDGFIVQLPLPDHIDESKVTMAINPKKMWMVFILKILG